MYNEKNHFHYFKFLILSVIKNFDGRENLKRAIEQAYTMESLICILQSSEPYAKKEIEIIKEAIKTAIRNNENFGPTTKNVFECIVSSEIAPSIMYQQILLYGSTHNLSL